MVRRNSANDGYDVISTLYSSTNYGDEDEDDGGSKGNEGTPLVWSIPERVEQSFDPVSILDSELNTGKLGDILENLIEVQLMENGPLEDRSDDMNLEDFKEEVKKALDGLTGPTPGTSVVTLNLNSLLGEFLSTSRVVLWRPLEDSD